MSSATSSQVLHDPYKHQREGQLPAPHSAACRAGIRLGCLVLKLSGKGTGLQTLGTGAVLCSRVLELELLGCYTCTQHSTEAQASPHRCRRVQKVPGVHRLWQRRTSKADPVRPIRVLNIRPGLPLSSLPCSALLSSLSWAPRPGGGPRCSAAASNRRDLSTSPHGGSAAPTRKNRFGNRGVRTNLQPLQHGQHLGWCRAADLRG